MEGSRPATAEDLSRIAEAGRARAPGARAHEGRRVVVGARPIAEPFEDAYGALIDRDDGRWSSGRWRRPSWASVWSPRAAPGRDARRHQRPLRRARRSRGRRGQAMADDLVAFCEERGCTGIDALALPGPPDDEELLRGVRVHSTGARDAPESSTGTSETWDLPPALRPVRDPTALVDLAVAAEGEDGTGFFLGTTSSPRRRPLRRRLDRPGRHRGPHRPPPHRPAHHAAPRRRPWKLAGRQSPSTLSHGRLVLGAGIGIDRSHEFSAFAEPSDDRSARRAPRRGTGHRHAALDRGAGPPFRAAIFTSTACAASPAIPTTPHPHLVRRPLRPHPAPLRRAARYDGVVPIGDLPPEAVPQLLTRCPAPHQPITPSTLPSPPHGRPARAPADNTSLQAPPGGWRPSSLTHL